MAVVGPLRALLEARGQALINQLLREAGGAGLAGAGLVAILVPLALAAPTAGSYIVGSRLGALAGHPDGGARAALTLSGLLLLISLGLGFLGGILGEEGDGGSSLRGYPVSRRTRLAAQLLSSSVGLGPVLALSMLTGLGAGLCVAHPGSAPIVLLLCAQTAAWVLMVQYLAARLRAAGLARPVFALSALTALGLLLLAKQSQPLLLAVARLLREGVSYSPTTVAALGLVDYATGHVAAAWLRQIVPLAFTALAIEIIARKASRDDRDEPGSRRGITAAQPLWSFGTPASGIARLFVSTVTHSRQGLTLFFMPPFIAGMITAISSGIAEDLQRRPPPPLIASLMPGSLDAVPLFGFLPFLLVHMNSELWLNQWGWDGRAVRALFVAPIAMRDLLLGKLMGIGAIVAAQYLMTAPLLGLLRLPRLAELLLGLGAGVFGLTVMAGLGHVLSAGLSRPLDPHGKINRTEGFAGMIGGGLGLVAALAPVVFIWAIARPWGEWGQAIGLWSLAAAGFAGYWRALPFFGRRVRDMREQFLEAT